MKRKIIGIGVIALLLITGFSTISTAMLMKPNASTPGDLKVKLEAKNSIGQWIFVYDEDVTVKIEEYDENENLVDTKSPYEVREVIEPYFHTIYFFEFEDIESLKHQGHTYKIIASGKGFDTDERLFASIGIFNQINNDASIHLEIQKEKPSAKTSVLMFSKILSRIFDNFPLPHLLLKLLKL